MNIIKYKLKCLFQKSYTIVALKAIGVIFELTTHFNKDIKTEIEKFGEGFIIVLCIEGGPALFLKKNGANLKVVKNISQKEDLTVYFKNFYSAFLVFSLSINFEQAVAEHRVITKGDTANGMTLIRCFTEILSYIPGERGQNEN